MSEITYKLKPLPSHNFKTWKFRSGANLENAKQKKVDAIAGIIKGIIADKLINKEEYAFISEWIVTYAKYFKTCPIADVLLGIREKIVVGTQSGKTISFLQKEVLKLRVLNYGEVIWLELEKHIEKNIVAGIVDGLISDNELNHVEMDYLDGWIRSLGDKSKDWPICELKKAVRKYKKQANDEKARFEIYKYLISFSGKQEGVPATALRSISIFPDPDAATFSFKKVQFYLSGRFELGTKAEICEMIKARGGYANEKWQHGHYLVVGLFGHPEWAHHNFGRKIEGEAKYGDTTSIISEQFLKKMFEKHPTILKELA
jgi:hypothetical protein